MSERIKYVTVYSIGQGYGGPEEGGWWFDTGVPVTSINVELTTEERDEAHEMFAFFRGEDTDAWDPNEYSEWLDEVTISKAHRVRNELSEQYPPTGKSNSVLGGDDYAVVFDDSYGRAYPEEYPRYE